MTNLAVIFGIFLAGFFTGLCAHILILKLNKKEQEETRTDPSFLQNASYTYDKLYDFNFDEMTGETNIGEITNKKAIND